MTCRIITFKNLFYKSQRLLILSSFNKMENSVKTATLTTSATLADQQVTTNLNQLLNDDKNDLKHVVMDNEDLDGLSLPKKQKLDNNNSENTNLEEKQTNPGATEKNDSIKLIKKKKYALLIGYSGTGYYGLQRNATTNQFRTIEDEIVEALVKIKAVPQAHVDEMFKMSFQRAARTDKGVSAAANLLSLKMELHENTVKELNELLPRQIKVFGYRRVTNSFDCKNNCDARTYMYIMPTYALCPVEEITTEAYRVNSQVLNEFNDILKLYIGTHNFHNFTSGKKFTDPSAKRYIMSMECGSPFIRDDLEFAVVTVKGQSFMLHQIRKMIGMAIAACKGFANKESIEKCYTADKIDMPIAPALGLMLERLHYDKYNKKFGNDGLHQPLIFKDCEDDIEKFKHEFIYPTVIEKEKNEKNMLKWLGNLCIHSYEKLLMNVPPGAYTGIGRAAHKLALVNETLKKEKNEDSDQEDE